MRRPAAQLFTALAALAAVIAPGPVALAQEDGFFANTKRLGRAAVEYRDDDIHAVAAYYHAQRDHDTRWILIQMALTTDDNQTIDRDDIRLVTPSGREVALPTQERVLRGVSQIRPVVLGATSSRHDVLSYFNERDRVEPLRLFSLSSDAVETNFVSIRHHVTYGDLFFESPTGLWEEGTHSLVIERDGVRAVLPVELQ
jgi:hypothetical protein